MKGTIKCFGLCLALPIMLGLSLNASLDVSAYKFDVGTIPLYKYTYIESGTSFNSFSSGFSFEIRSVNSLSSGSGSGFDYTKTSAPNWYNVSYNSDNNTCYHNSDLGSNTDGHLHLNTNNSKILQLNAYSYEPQLYEYSVNSTVYNPCLTTFGPYTTPALVFDGILNPSFTPLRPYRLNYSSYTFKDTYTSNSGVVYNSHGLNLRDIVGFENAYQVFNDDVSQMTIPIGMIRDITRNNDNFPDIVAGTTLDFDGVINFGLDITSFDETVINATQVKLYYRYVKASNQSSGSDQIIPCTTDLEVQEDIGEPGDNMYYLYYHCHFVAPEDVYRGDLISFWLKFLPGSGQTSIWSVEYASGMQDYQFIGITFSNYLTDTLSVVSNGDTTPGGSIGAANTGSNPGASPGSAESQIIDGSTDNADWFSSLTNLFNFNVLNPFSSIYALFQDNSSCANIPIIAGMIHSSETTYCPWFPSSVRSVLTPIFSLASMMLVFGFVVRWLGSSSGNFFEDSKGEELTNVNNSGFRRFKK